MKKLFLLFLLGTALPPAQAQVAPRESAPATSEDLRTLLQRGKASLDAGDHYAALEAGNAAVKLEPNNANAHTLRGLARSFTKDYRGALQDYTAAIENDNRPGGNLYFWRAQMEEKLEDYPAAMADYQKLLQLKPGDPKGTEALARVEGKIRSATPKTPPVDPDDPNRPFMLSLRKLNADMQAIMDEKTEVYGMIDQLARTKRRLQKGMVELEAFHDPKWPVFKAAYQQTMEKLSVHVKD